MLKLAGLVNDSIVDGPGLRVALFAQGCPHHCPGCHNPETWSFDGGTEILEERVLEIVKSNPLCGGVTFSGGEPFAQAEAFARLAKLLKEHGYEIASYSGYTFEALLDGTQEQRALLKNIDVLIDGPYLEAERSVELNFRGSKNQRVIDVPASLREGKAVSVNTGRWLGQY